MSATLPFPFVISGVHAQIGEVMTMEDWAELARIPHRNRRGRHLRGSDIKRLLGVEAKSWDATEQRFATLDTIVRVAAEALASAGREPTEVDQIVVSTCSPHQIMLDQDAFALAREIGVPDGVAPLQLGAGCAGLGRAVALLSRMRLKTALVVCYNIGSSWGVGADGGPLPIYAENSWHPFAKTLWCAGALFSDACTAMVFERDEDSPGICLYSRDSHSFGSEPGFLDPLVHYPGGGVAHPPGRPGSAELSAFGLNGDALARYYAGGMMLNHQALERALPGYVERVRRVYTHQAGPALVEDFAQLADLPPGKAPTNVRQLGNLVSAATPTLFYSDCLEKEIGNGDLACFSVVGAGPERGAFIAPVRIPGMVTSSHPPVPVPLDAR
ncbi:3-oxoacyl-[acyl-carrier-protein] synthase III C-terminal domain-containing protein [Kitasatospora kifunensis]|uniref:3-oxoacyl-[acyl-carrier-protein] synthase-3 n=1 Tax=Kitasatospora kifunensis TaxID=58351 RepID=A0A7W7R908_KITKI|nr:3-oxoacyl-[acyl-carrier-protein] synthase III C-terminal domain-containing protein [Kitasatospora kifunensis]MBB4927529.1 3-oxoacyl-[acyl-carrier-protein] synthase-3 [Kitasatospora kifunensis]